jgi:hypothetical protein
MDEQEAAEITVKVSLTTIYAKVLDIDKKLVPLVSGFPDHEARLRLVEHRMWMLAGVSLVAGAIAGWLLATITHS